MAGSPKKRARREAEERLRRESMEQEIYIPTLEKPLSKEDRDLIDNWRKTRTTRIQTKKPLDHEQKIAEQRVQKDANDFRVRFILDKDTRKIFSKKFIEDAQRSMNERMGKPLSDMEIMTKMILNERRARKNRRWRWTPREGTIPRRFIGWLQRASKGIVKEISLRTYLKLMEWR